MVLCREGPFCRQHRQCTASMQSLQEICTARHCTLSLHLQLLMGLLCSTGKGQRPLLHEGVLL